MLTKKEAHASPLVISNKIFIYDIFIHALIDSNTIMIYSFAALAYVKKLDKQSKALNLMYCIVIPLGNIMYSS